MVEYEKDAVVQPYVTEYIRSRLKKRDGIMAELEKTALQRDIPIVQPETAKLLETLIMAKQPQKILEVGCAIGYSAILMAEACENAEITTLEFDASLAAEAKENIEQAGLSERINVVFADARDYISYLEEDEIFDIIFLDGPKAHYIHMLDDCMRLLRKNGMLICDNVLYKGMTATDTLVIRRKITIVKRLRKFIDTITERADMETSILPVGDGVTLTVKRF
ncbi:MAG: O-methyltransferase [Clostridia bacterium]|nr:O-methyltransferase [Clostridia bacterium]